jgi:hypothetical protein
VDAEQSLRQGNGIGDPVMLDGEHHSVLHELLVHDRSTDGPSQVSGGDAHCGAGVDGAEVGHEHSAHGNAMAIVIS